MATLFPYSIPLSLLTILAAASAVAATPPPDPTQEKYTLDPGVGLKAMYTEVSGTNGIATGPMAGIRMRFSTAKVFAQVESSAAAVFGLDKSPALIGAFGISFGIPIPKSSTRVWAGVGYEDIFSYKVPGTVALKAGVSFPLSPTTSLEWELSYRNYQWTTPTYIYGFPTFSTEAVISFPIKL